jgi:hypothetical protein
MGHVTYSVTVALLKVITIKGNLGNKYTKESLLEYSS